MYAVHQSLSRKQMPSMIPDNLKLEKLGFWSANVAVQPNLRKKCCFFVCTVPFHITLISTVFFFIFNVKTACTNVWVNSVDPDLTALKEQSE